MKSAEAARVAADEEQIRQQHRRQTKLDQIEVSGQQQQQQLRQQIHKQEEDLMRKALLWKLKIRCKSTSPILHTKRSVEPKVQNPPALLRRRSSFSFEPLGPIEDGGVDGVSEVVVESPVNSQSVKCSPLSDELHANPSETPLESLQVPISKQQADVISEWTTGGQQAEGVVRFDRDCDSTILHEQQPPTALAILHAQQPPIALATQGKEMQALPKKRRKSLSGVAVTVPTSKLLYRARQRRHSVTGIKSGDALLLLNNLDRFKAVDPILQLPKAPSETQALARLLNAPEDAAADIDPQKETSDSNGPDFNGTSTAESAFLLNPNGSDPNAAETSKSLNPHSLIPPIN